MARPADVVSISHDDHPALARTLERALTEEAANQIQGFMSAKDWPDFERRRGRIDGLKLAISICQEAQKRLDA